MDLEIFNDNWDTDAWDNYPAIVAAIERHSTTETRGPALDGEEEGPITGSQPITTVIPLIANYLRALARILGPLSKATFNKWIVQASHLAIKENLMVEEMQRVMSACVSPDLQGIIWRFSRMTQIPNVLVLFGHLGGAMGCRYLFVQVATIIEEPDEDLEMFLTHWGLVQTMAGIVVPQGGDGVLDDLQFPAGNL